MSFSKSLKERACTVWEAGYQHPFVQELGNGTLDKAKFQFYLLQDYHYLLQYSKVFALAAVKSNSEELQTRFSTIQYHILVNEMNLHREYMSGFGITPRQVMNAKASLYNRTYTANMLATAQTGELAETLAAIFPCAWTYGDYAKRLKIQYADKLENNFYRTWIEKYAGDEYHDSFIWFYDLMDDLVSTKTVRQQEKIAGIFVSSVEFEYLFWEMAYHQEMSFR